MNACFLVMLYITHKSTMRFCSTGTGTNVCYMEELKNIEKTKENIGKMEREERTPESEEDKVRSVFTCQ